jgi:hypothetical protein
LYIIPNLRAHSARNSPQVQVELGSVAKGSHHWLVISDVCVLLPSGELTVGYGKSPFLMGKSTISIGPFSIAFCIFHG